MMGAKAKAIARLALLCSLCVNARAADPLAPRWPDRSPARVAGAASSPEVRQSRADRQVLEMILKSDGRWSARVGAKWLSVGDREGGVRIVSISRFKVALSNGSSVSLGQQWPNQKGVGK